jgi:ABC-type oligopeptide transport system substrate-binding subunit
MDIIAVPKFRDELNKIQEASATGLFRLGWSNDYPSVVNFLDPLLGSTSADNRGKYSNPQFDSLVKKAAAALTDKDRYATAQQAEKLALDEMGLIPLWYRTQFRVFDGAKFAGVAADFFENPTLASIRLK